MASNVIDFGRASALPPFALLQQALPRMSRHQLEGVIELLIDHIDAMEPDSDLELNGDELDGEGAEDSFGITPNQLLGPGCPIADCSEDDLEDECEAADDGCGARIIQGQAVRGHSDLVTPE